MDDKKCSALNKNYQLNFSHNILRESSLFAQNIPNLFYLKNKKHNRKKLYRLEQDERLIKNS